MLSSGVERKRRRRASRAWPGVKFSCLRRYDKGFRTASPEGNPGEKSRKEYRTLILPLIFPRAIVPSL